jgi:DNA-binding PadR family transcriptional regulator
MQALILRTGRQIMKIDYAILGLLSWKPLTGYDIKKIIQESPYIYWSGNNNQIYKSLIQLEKDGMVSCRVIHQENGPSKKEYDITDLGYETLNHWIKFQEFEMPEYKKTFLVQLSWSANLEKAELDLLLRKYKARVEEIIVMYKEVKRRKINFPDRNEKESYIWNMLYDNMIQTYVAEIDWVDTFRKGIIKW